MAEAIRHRGPDENGHFVARGISIAHRRLSIVGLEDGQQPIYNEEKTVAVIFNGELFDFVEKRTALEKQGHVFRTRTDGEIIVHLYEQYGEDFVDHLKGQFAFALYDNSQRRLFLGRDRMGICPLHIARHGNRFYFASEIKAILASGEVAPAADPMGIDNIFTFFAMPRRRTMYAGIESVLPGHILRISFNDRGQPATISERCYWDLQFPDAGEEYDTQDEGALVDEYEATFRRAVELRLRADVPVVGYLSGGIDSAAVLSQATAIVGRPIPSFTVRVPNNALDETDRALAASRHIGTIPNFVDADPALISKIYPSLVSAADCPVVDTSCSALHALSRAVSDQGYKVVLTGEGSDEALAGYVWFKIQRIAEKLSLGLTTPPQFASRMFRRSLTPRSCSWRQLAENDMKMGGIQAQSDMYHLMGTSRDAFYSREMFEQLNGRSAYDDLEIDYDKLKRWDPLNRSLYLGYKVMLAGMLLNHKGDRVTMANSVEGRYPFLDEDLIALTSRLAPRWKLRGLTLDKYLLRKTARRWLPDDIAMRPKAMFRAPFAESFVHNAPNYVDQLLSEEALRKTGYFDVSKVRRFYGIAKSGRLRSWHFFNSMGLASVLSTQLWHHQNLGGGLCELEHRNFAPGTRDERPVITSECV
jgi:asparagine synthase (glutamine-hydrolysing)